MSEYCRNTCKKLTFGVQILVTAVSLYHDHAPANVLGIASSWIIRGGSVLGIDAKASYIWAFETLGDMVAAVEREMST
jgi:hypothetical protein